MSTFLNRLTPETLSAIITDLTWQRFLSRDEACAALDTCKTCAFYAEALQDPDLVVVPSEDAKPGWILAEASALARRRAEEKAAGKEEEDDNGVASGIAETNAYIGSRKESIEADRTDYTPPSEWEENGQDWDAP